MNQAAGLADNQWDDLIESLEAEKCILFLGTGIYEAPGGGDFDTALRNWMGANQPNHPHIRIWSDDGFMLFQKERHRRPVGARLEEFFRQPFPETEAVFKKLATLPFSAILTLTSDNLLPRTFQATGFPYYWDFYFKNRPHATKFEKPSKDKPLIYHLLGNIDEVESLMLTHRDFFDYLESIFKGNSMHPDLRQTIEKAEFFIFLGLPYEKWYFQLLLRVFSMHSERLNNIERLAPETFQNPEWHTLYSEEFKIAFFSSGIGSFVDELYTRCGQEGILKSVPAPDPAIAALPLLNKNAFQDLIGAGKIEEAMQHLFVFLKRQPRPNPDAENDLLILQNWFNRLSSRELNGTIFPNDATIENNQITARFLALMSSVVL